jgi:hypothetical protein
MGICDPISVRISAAIKTLEAFRSPSLKGRGWGLGLVDTDIIVF